MGRGRWPARALGEDTPVHEVPSAGPEPTLRPVPQSLPLSLHFQKQMMRWLARDLVNNSDSLLLLLFLIQGEISAL